MRKGGRDTAERKPNDYQLKQKSGMKSRDIVHYANTNECILTVVIDRFSHWMLLGEDMNGDPWRKLGCPLVAAIPEGYLTVR